MTIHSVRKKDSFSRSNQSYPRWGARRTAWNAAVAAARAQRRGPGIYAANLFARSTRPARVGAFHQHDVGLRSRYSARPAARRKPGHRLMYTLKRMSMREQLHRDTDAPASAKAFTDNVDDMGSFEFGPGHELSPAEPAVAALKMGPTGLAMYAAACPAQQDQEPWKSKVIIRKAKELRIPGWT